MHMSIYIYVCIHIRWTCTYIFKCPFKYIIYKHIYIYNTHINPVCEETLGPLVLEYINIYICYGKHTKCLLCLSTALCSSQSDTLRPDPPTIYIYICTYVYACIYICMNIILYTYIYMRMYVCVYMSACVYKNIYAHTYICMYIYICMYVHKYDGHAHIFLHIYLCIYTNTYT